MRFLTSTILLFFTSLLFSQTNSLTYKKDKIDYLLSQAHHRGILNGNALVAVNDTIIYQSEFGYARGDQSEKLQKNHIFKIGSVSKEFDGVAIMLLHQQGKLDLDSKVSKYFPSLPAWAEKVSVKNLLQYTSGLPASDNEEIRTDEQVWDFLNNLDSLAFEPGSDYWYNNLNTFLRKRIVEKVSGQSFSQFVQQNLLDPAGIKHAIIDPESSEPQLVKAFDTEFVEDDYPEYMSGWTALNIQDMYKWIKSLHSGKIVNQNSLDKLSTNFKNKQACLGHLDFKEGNLHYQHHHGQSGHFETSIYYNALDKFTVIFLTNQRGNNLGDLTVATDAILRGEEFQIPKKSIELSLRAKIYHYGYEKGIKFYDSIQKYARDIYDFKNEQKELLETAEFLVKYKKQKEALKILEITCQKFPKSDRAFFELAKFHSEKGNSKLARENYEKAYKLNPENKEALKRLQAAR